MDSNNVTATVEVEQAQNKRATVDLLKPETCPGPLKKFYTDEHRAVIADAVANGDVKVEQKEVKVGKDKSGTGQDEKWAYLSYQATTAKGMTALSRGKNTAAKPLPDGYDKLSDNEKKRADNDAKDGAADYFNYGFGLTIMQPIRVMLANSLGGVEKEIEKQVSQVMKTGIYDTPEEAREAIIAQRKKKGLEVPAEDSAD